MGTRSLTRINQKDGTEIINMYRQFDGYPSGHGKELHEFLDGMHVINGINGQKAGEAANGAGCLAAQLIANFKKEIGGIYIYPTKETDCGQDYEYIVTVGEPGAPLEITCNSFRGELFKGDVDAFGEFCNSDE